MQLSLIIASWWMDHLLSSQEKKMWNWSSGACPQDYKKRNRYHSTLLKVLICREILAFHVILYRASILLRGGELYILFPIKNVFSCCLLHLFSLWSWWLCIRTNCFIFHLPGILIKFLWHQTCIKWIIRKFSLVYLVIYLVKRDSILKNLVSQL